MLVPFKETKTMGVINLTPNSFSDSTSMLIDTKLLKRNLTQLKKIPGLIYDFGFESTAPMNSAISSLEERNRFDLFFESIVDIDLSGQWISLDTYRPINFSYFEEKLKSRYDGLGFIFNDVSGVLDASLFDLLEGKKNQENFYYIYSFSHIPSRDKALSHMDFVKEGDILRQAIL
jgi:hypothetical protein